MYKFYSSRPSLIALAVGTAFSTVAYASETPASTQPLIKPAQTYFPVAGTTDSERIDSRAFITPIKADYAYQRRVTGRGVTIAVLDTGISGKHAEFAELGKLLPGYNALNGGSNVTDYAGHGTHVAGILGAGRNGQGIFGVAYDAQILPVKVLGDNGVGSTAYLDAGLRYSIGRASIVNMSLGASAVYNSSAMQEAVRAGMLIVVAAGNEKAANPNWPARFAKEAWANNQIIAVGAVDANNQIASFSNRAGDTAAWYIVAPGVGILSPYYDGQYAYMSGTSMAAPVVSGAAALIKQYWPKLRADQIANIMFVTATDLGAPGIDAVYGRGLLNVEKALQPIGSLTTTTFNGSTISILQGTARPSSATSQLWRLALAGNLRVLGFDDYQRDYSVDLGQSIAPPPTLSVSEVFGNLDRRMEVAESVFSDGGRLSVAYNYSLPVAGNAQWHSERDRIHRLAGFSLVSKSEDGSETAFGVGGLASNYFGVGGLHVGQDLALGMVPALSNPYFSLVPSAAHAATAYHFGDIKLKFGLLSSSVNSLLSSQDAMCAPAGLAADPVKADSALIELSHSFDHASVSMSLSQTSERNTYLGAQSSGALALSPHATTSAIQLAGAFLLTEDWALAGQASYGTTPGTANNGSLISEISGTRTNAFSLALVTVNRLRLGDRFSFAVSQPMRTYSGRMVLDAPTHTDEQGNPMRERVILSMVPGGREVRGEFNYHTPLGQYAAIGATLMLRSDPNNMDNAPNEKLMAIRYTKRF